jgi:hypothetical protein
MMTREDRQEALSLAYIKAVAAFAGMTYSVPSKDYGIDITLHEVRSRKRRYRQTGYNLEIQGATIMTNREVSWAPKPDTLTKIPVSAVHDFLTRRGWVENVASRDRFRYSEHSEMVDDDGKRLEYRFPAADTSADDPLSVLHFIENEARFWELDPWAILTELTGGPLAEPVRTSVPA